MSIPSSFVMTSHPFNQQSLSSYNEMSSMSAAPSYSSFISTPEITPSIPPSITPGMRDSPFNEQPEPYIQYYFENVRKIQFVLAGKELTQTLGFVSHLIEQTFLP